MGYRPISCPYCGCQLTSMLYKYRENPWGSQQCPDCRRWFSVEEEVTTKYTIIKAADPDPAVQEDGGGI